MDARELRLDARGEGLDRQRLGQARHAFKQHVAVGQNGDQNALGHGALADDALAHLGQQQFNEPAVLDDLPLDPFNFRRDHGFSPC